MWSLFCLISFFFHLSFTSILMYCCLAESFSPFPWLRIAIYSVVLMEGFYQGAGSACKLGVLTREGKKRKKKKSVVAEKEIGSTSVLILFFLSLSFIRVTSLTSLFSPHLSAPLRKENQGHCFQCIP